MCSLKAEKDTHEKFYFPFKINKMMKKSFFLHLYSSQNTRNIVHQSKKNFDMLCSFPQTAILIIWSGFILSPGHLQVVTTIGDKRKSLPIINMAVGGSHIPLN